MHFPQFLVSLDDFSDGSLQFWKVVFIHFSIMSGDGESFSFNKRPFNVSQFFPELFLRSIQCRDKLCSRLSLDVVGSGDVKAMAASVDYSVDCNAVTNIFEFPATKDGHRYSRRERA